MFKCGISGVRKKKWRKKIKVFLGENLECGILLGSYSLVGLCVYFYKLKLQEKKWKFSKCFSERFEIEGCWKILKLSKKNVRVVCYPVIWAPCCETWLKKNEI